MPVKPTEDEDRLVLPGVGRRRPVRMTAEIDMRQRTESPVTMRVDEAAPPRLASDELGRFDVIG